MKKIIVFCPVKEKESIKEAMFAAGGGRIGNYDKCSFESLGVGQFRPLDGSNAFVGSIDQVEQVKEYKVEMVCDDNLLRDVILAMKEAHPYEEVAYEVYSIEIID